MSWVCQHPVRVSIDHRRKISGDEFDLPHPKTGLLLVSFRGSNGGTVLAAVSANKFMMKWEMKQGEQSTNYFGSSPSSTFRIRQKIDFEEVYAPLKNVVPMGDPSDSAIVGWDCSSTNLADAMNRAQLFEPEFQRQLCPPWRIICGAGRCSHINGLRTTLSFLASSVSPRSTTSSLLVMTSKLIRPR